MRARGPSRSAVAAVTTLALGIGFLQPAAADEASPATPPARPTTGTVARLTLVTGHQLQVSRAPDGRQAASVEAPAGRRSDTFSFTDKSGDLHVVPREALPYLQAGKLDGRLFNVTDLVEQGYANRPDVPLIISYPRGSSALKSRSLKAVTSTRAFASAGAIAVKVRGHAFWDDFTEGAQTYRDGATKLWLDGKVRASLEQSVPLVNAPQAWTAGYDGKGVTVAVLDSGYDVKHPDLAGRVSASKSFDGTSSVADGNGHGTHVAATVAGTGSASQGKRKGVAPAATLMVGKVLGDDGSGDESWVLAGMEWAARGGAKVVSMSLGGGPSDGNDPLSQAVDSLTAETGALFVVAAGNSGPGQGTVSTPGAATHALTIGNTDKSDQLNDSSSRGPRLGDHAVKPELTAPGTDIIAARAAGTSLGSPVDANYTSLTGTSMATPHVAGAAAILAQRHPDWTAEQLKAALVGTAKPPAQGTVFEHGAGRLDVAAALGSTVHADSTLSFGYAPWPGTGIKAIERVATYRNSGSTPVTLDLAVAAESATGGTVAPDTASVTPAKLVVPPGGTAQATVSVDPAKVDGGTDVSGLLVATGNGTTVRTPWSYGEESEQYDLTVTATGTDGKPSRGWAQIWSEAMGMYYYGVRIDADGKQTVRLPKDEYMVIGGATELDADGTIVAEAVGGTPQLSLTADTTVALDARKAKPLGFQTPRPSTPIQLSLGWARWYDSGATMDGFLRYGGVWGDVPKLSVIPSTAVTNGKFEFSAGGRLVARGAEPGRTPYLYDLALPTDGRFPATATYRVRDRDLARIDSTFAGVGTAGRTTVENRLGFTPLAQIRVGGTTTVQAAGPRVDYVSGNGTEWKSWVGLPQAGDEDVPTMWDNSRAYRGGSRQATKWWGAPYTVGTDSDYSATDVYRDGDRLSFLIRDYQDGEADHWGDSYWNEHPTQSVHSRFYQNGKLVKEDDRGSFDVDGLPDPETTYRFVHTITRRGPIWTSSSFSETDWTFRSARQSQGWPLDGIPLLDFNWTIPTDAQNQARAFAPFTIGLHARHVRGLGNARLTPAKLWVSYDDGKRWHQVPLLRRSGDRYTGLLLHPPKSLTSGWVSLRAEVADSKGGAIKQTTLRAYSLR